MKIGLQIPVFTWPGGPENLAPTLKDIGRTAEEAGFHSVWVMDHFFQLLQIGKPEEPMLEGYTALSFLAAVTERVKLGTMVTGVIYRQPGFLIKQATTLDVLSGGRAYFGVGAAWYDREAAGLGFPFPPVKTRFEWLEETLQIAHHMWSGNTDPYEGTHFQLAEPICSPMPLSQPHPPILIGGMGEKKTLRFVAKYANATNMFHGAGTDVLKHKLGILRSHCDDLGRDFSEIEITTLGGADLSPGKMVAKDVLDLCRSLADLGVHQVIFNLPRTLHERTPLEIFGEEIIPAVAGF